MARTKTRSDDELLDAVGEALLRHGPQAFTLADVSRRVGLSPATLLQRFGSKEALVRAFARRASSAPVLDVAPGAARPILALRRAFRALARALGGARGLRSSVALFAEDVRDPVLRAAARRHARRFSAEIAALLRIARARGELRRGAPVAPLTRQLTLVWNGALTAHAVGGAGPLERAVDAAVRFALAPYLTARGSR